MRVPFSSSNLCLNPLLNVEGWFTNKYKGQAQIDKVHEVMLKNDFIFIGFSAFIAKFPLKELQAVCPLAI